jgi:hypothetical protein
MGLEVQIGADASELDKEIKKVESTLKKLESQKAIQISLGADTSKLDKNIASSQTKLEGLKKALGSAGSAVQSFTPKVASGGNALMQFSRIAQDAPFGIMGIGNNITATAESFGHLVKETGSAGSALKAVASSILGTGGILLAVSLVTTGLTYMSQQGLTVSDVFSKLTGTFNENANAIKKAQIEGARSASEEIINLKALASVAQNEALSKKDRLIAVEKLQQQYPGYFANLSKEAILTGNITTVVNELTKALIQKAIAEKLASDSADLQLKIFEANAKLVNQKNKTSQLEIKLAKDLALAQKSVANSTAQLAIIRAKGLNAINASKEAEQEARDEIIKGTEALKQRQDIINKLTAASIKLSASQPDTAKKINETPQVSGLKSSVSPVNDLVDVTTLEALTGQIDKFGNKIKELPGIIKTGMDKAKVAFDMSGVPMLEALQKFNADADAIIQDSLTSTFNNLGTVIGEALAKGENVFSAIGKSLLSSLGSFISDMGGLLIKYGTLAVAKGALDEAIAIGGPFAVAAGVAAIGVGIALKAAGSAISSKAREGMGGSMQSGASYASPSRSSGASDSSSFGGGNIVFEIRGTTLIGVLNNTLDQNRRLGGNLPIG